MSTSQPYDRGPARISLRVKLFTYCSFWLPGLKSFPRQRRQEPVAAPRGPGEAGRSRAAGQPLGPGPSPAQPAAPRSSRAPPRPAAAAHPPAAGRSSGSCIACGFSGFFVFCLHSGGKGASQPAVQPPKVVVLPRRKSRGFTAARRPRGRRAAPPPWPAQEMPAGWSGEGPRRGGKRRRAGPEEAPATPSTANGGRAPPPQGRWEFPASEVRRSGGSRRCRRGCRCGCVVVGGVIPQMCRLGVLSVVWGCVKERREGRSPPRPPALAGRESYLTAKMPSLQQCVPL